MDILTFTPHPFAEKFALLEEEEYRRLVASIQANGLQSPILVSPFTRQIIDGRNRLRACAELGLKPEIEIVPSNTPEWQIIEIILARNVERRHLNATQRAALYTEPEVLNAVSERVAHGKKLVLSEAAKQQLLPGIQGFQKSRSDRISAPTGGKTSEILAKQASVHPATMNQAIAVRKAAEAGDEKAAKGLEKMKSGEASVNAVYTELKQTKATQRAAANPTTAEVERQQAEALRPIVALSKIIQLLREIVLPTQTQHVDVEKFRTEMQSRIDQADAVLVDLQNSLNDIAVEAVA